MNSKKIKIIFLNKNKNETNVKDSKRRDMAGLRSDPFYFCGCDRCNWIERLIRSSDLFSTNFWFI